MSEQVVRGAEQALREVEAEFAEAQARFGLTPRQQHELTSGITIPRGAWGERVREALFEAFTDSDLCRALSPDDWAVYVARDASDVIEEMVNQNVRLHLLSPADDPLAAYLAVHGLVFEEQTFVGSEMAGPRPLLPKESDFQPEPVLKPSWVARLLGAGSRYDLAVAESRERAQQAYERARVDAQQRRREWVGEVTELRSAFEAKQTAERQRIEQHNTTIREESAAVLLMYQAGDPRAVKSYFEIALESADFLPGEGADPPFSADYHASTGRLIVDVDLPDWNALAPLVRGYRPSRSETAWLEDVPRSDSEREALFRTTLCSIALKTAREVFAHDERTWVRTVVVNCHRRIWIDGPSPERQCVFSVSLDRATTSRLPHRINAEEALTRFGPRIAQHLCDDEWLLPVEPVLTEHAAMAPAAPANLGAIDPLYFEAFVRDLFAAMGYEAETTRASGDGGIDVVARDPRPLMGGSAIIQVKRYAQPVGVGVVRDLYGTLVSEGANKGILITTSSFTSGALEFAEGKPIELVDGAHLIALCSEYGIDAHIGCLNGRGDS